MSYYEQALKKVGLPLIKSFIQSTESIIPGLPSSAQKRNSIVFKHKTYKDGKVIDTKYIQTLNDAFVYKAQSKNK